MPLICEITQKSISKELNTSLSYPKGYQCSIVFLETVAIMILNVYCLAIGFALVYCTCYKDGSHYHYGIEYSSFQRPGNLNQAPINVICCHCCNNYTWTHPVSGKYIACRCRDRDYCGIASGLVTPVPAWFTATGTPSPELEVSLIHVYYQWCGWSEILAPTVGKCGCKGLYMF